MKQESNSEKTNSNYRRGLTLEEDYKYKQAIQKYLIASKEGSAEAEYRLGHIYTNGLGIAQNIKLSLYWYEQSAKKKYPPALYTLGVIYANGAFVKKNIKKAYNFFSLCEKYADKRSFYYLNSLFSRSILLRK
jgi:TPR repeat protein|tara:strand:- start:484 stop:882 length:399 start_codon:yes stop_codon:yes gene_type:complete